ncbi:MAG: hypothetical protein WC365_05770 [Candidatus Babeliales bacterium]|jgi:hypothetical protein
MLKEVLSYKNITVREAENEAREEIIKVLKAEFPEFKVEVCCFRGDTVHIRGKGDALRFDISCTPYANGMYVRKSKQYGDSVFTKAEIDAIKSRINKYL